MRKAPAELDDPEEEKPEEDTEEEKQLKILLNKLKLLEENCTVTICHSRTENLTYHTKNAVHNNSPFEFIIYKIKVCFSILIYLSCG